MAANVTTLFLPQQTGVLGPPACAPQRHPNSDSHESSGEGQNRSNDPAVMADSHVLRHAAGAGTGSDGGGAAQQQEAQAALHMRRQQQAAALVEDDGSEGASDDYEADGEPSATAPTAASTNSTPNWPGPGTLNKQLQLSAAGPPA